MKKASSQNLKILEAMKKGARITPMDALRRFGCFRLSARIADLRMAWHKIFSHMVERNGKHVAEYYMGAKRKLT